MKTGTCAILLLGACIFTVCLGPFDNAGHANRMVGVQDNWVTEHSYIVPDGNEFDAVLVLRGPKHGNICSATIQNPFPQFPPDCAGVNGASRITPLDQRSVTIEHEKD